MGEAPLGEQDVLESALGGAEGVAGRRGEGILARKEMRTAQGAMRLGGRARRWARVVARVARGMSLADVGCDVTAHLGVAVNVMAGVVSGPRALRSTTERTGSVLLRRVLVAGDG